MSANSTFSWIKISLISILLLSLFIGFSGCDVLDLCGGYGYLTLTNKSTKTVQRIRIDGVNYGTLSPGESDTFDLTVGSHVVETINADTGRNACGSFVVTIVECDSQAYSCSG